MFEIYTNRNREMIAYEMWLNFGASEFGVRCKTEEDEIQNIKMLLNLPLMVKLQ